VAYSDRVYGKLVYS